MGILVGDGIRDIGTYQTEVAERGMRGEMGAPSDFYYCDTLHAIAINTRETEMGSISNALRSKQHLIHSPVQMNGYNNGRRIPAIPKGESVNLPKSNTEQSNCGQSGPKTEETKVTRPPPKKKWIKEYLEEELQPEVSVHVVSTLPVPRTNGTLVRTSSPVKLAPLAPLVPPSLTTALPVPVAVHHEITQEHSRQRTTSNNNGPSSTPSPPSAGSSGSTGSAPRAGTREVHNKLEKNRRAHLKECFELLKKQLPSTSDDKKTSNLSILGSAIRYIQMLKRKERECEHELERLAREKIALQQKLSALRREAAIRIPSRNDGPTLILQHDGILSIDGRLEHKDVEDRVNGQVLGIPISITSSAAGGPRLEGSPPRSLNLSTKLRTLPIQITPTTSQVVRTTYGARHNTLTLTTLAPANSVPTTQNGHIENGVTTNIGTTIVHPAQIHLPLSQVVNGGGLVVNASTLQLLSAPALRVLHTPTIHTNGVTTDNNRIQRENGIISTATKTAMVSESTHVTTVNTNGTTNGTAGSVLVNGLTPIVVSQSPHLLTHTLSHKMVDSQMVKGPVSSLAPLAVSGQYLSATAIMNPVVVVTSANKT